MGTSLIINSTDQKGNKLQKTITNIRSTAQSEALKTWAQGLNAITTNNEVGITKVVTTDLLNGETSTKLPRNSYVVEQGATSTHITSISNADIVTSIDQLQNVYLIRGAVMPSADQVSYNFTPTGDSTDALMVAMYNSDSNTNAAFQLARYSDETPIGTLTINIAEDDTYAADSISIAITA